MGIDWITFSAQLVNLAILVYLLYRFLYKPMLNAIDGREARITEEIKKSRDMAAEAEKRLDELNRKHAELETQRQQILQQAHRVADELQARLEREIRADAVDIGSVVVVRIAIAVDIGEVGGRDHRRAV